jgi:hypothetical protein
MAIAVRTKDPAAKLDYQFDWNDWLVGDTIASSSWVVPAGLTNVNDSFTAQTTTIRLSGGTHGVNYECVNHIITASGQEDDRSITIHVRQKEAGASADATARATAMTTLYEWAQINVAPVLEEAELETILDRNQRASTWTTVTAYFPGDVVIPTLPNGRRYICRIGGTSGTSDPFSGQTWQSSRSTVITDDGVTWQEDGPAYPNIYDLRQSAYECWDLRVRRAAQFVKTGEIEMQQVHDHSVAMRDNFTPMGFA